MSVVEHEEGMQIPMEGSFCNKTNHDAGGIFYKVKKKKN